MTAQDDQKFYEKKERLLRRVRAGTATQAEKEWLTHWGFLEKPKSPPLKRTSESPTHTNKVYRYRGPMSARPLAKVEGSPQAEPRPKKGGRKSRPKKRSVWVKYQSMG